MAETGRVRKNHFGRAELRWPARLGQEEYIPAGGSKISSSKTAANEEARHTLRCVEPLSEARTTHGKRRVPARRGRAGEKSDFFSILLGGSRPSVEEAHSKTSGCHTCRNHCTDYPTGRETCSSRFTTSKVPTQIRHMGFRPEPFIL
jgi:hypothetical protein